jgi:LmbE family N-acetylglucosaminyl deacetylase
MTEQLDTTQPSIALMVFAHADDETLLAGALIPKLIDDGWQVQLLCIAPGDDADRYARMELAAAELGITTVSSLRFAPAPLPGEAPADTSSQSSPVLISAPEDVIVSLIEGKLAASEPSMIITHSPEGDTGHPDHALCHRVTVLAAASTVPSTAVYALAWPRKMVWLYSIAGRLFRMPSRKKADEAMDSGAEVKHTERLPITHTHNVRRFLSVRKRAARHYAKELSQGPLLLRLLEAAPTWLQWPVLGKVRLSRLR